MPDELDDELAEWGRSATPPVDGAFANRLETSLRSTMLDRTTRGGAGWAATIFRPGVVVMAIAVLIFGFAFVSGDSEEPGLADDGSTLDGPSTTVGPDASDSIAPTVPEESSTTTLPLGPDDPPQIDTPGSGTIVQPEVTDRPGTDQTTVPPRNTPTTRPAERDATTTPETTTPRQDTISSTSTWPPGLLVIEGTATADGRRVVLEWTVAGETSPISGWVIQRTVGDRTAVAATVRDPENRSVSIIASDRQETYRIEARAEEGVVLGASDELSLSPDE